MVLSYFSLNSIGRKFLNNKIPIKKELAKKVVESVQIPVVVTSGAGSLENIKELIEYAKPSGVAIASLLHYNKYTINDIKEYLRSVGIKVSK